MVARPLASLSCERASHLSRRLFAAGLVSALALASIPGEATAADDKDDDDDKDGKGSKDEKDEKDEKDKGVASGGDKDKDDDDKTLAQKAADRYPQPVAVGALIAQKVLRPLESQPVLGVVRAIVRKADGTIEAVIDYGGYFGFGGRRIAVPIDAMALLSPELEIVEFEPAELSAFPTFDAAGTTPLPPEAIIRIGLAKPSH